jgi:hypothetical protein
MGAWRNRHRLADGTGRVASGRCEAGLPKPSDRGIEVARQQMEVVSPGVTFAPAGCISRKASRLV